MGDRPAKLNEKKSDRELERKIRSYLLEEQHEIFLAAVRKWEILAATKLKMSEWKNVNNNRYDISSIERVTIESFWKFHVVVVQNSGKEMYKKSVLHVQSFSFLFFVLLIRPIVVFSPFSLPSPLSITRFYILFEQTINIIESFAFSPGLNYILIYRTWAINLCLEFSRCSHNYIACLAGFTFLLAKTSFFQVCGWNV